jgi:signal transduction histidine kinase
VYAYFILLSILVLVMFLLETAEVNGGSVGNLLVVLLLQSGVLTFRWQVLLHLSTVCGFTAIAAMYMPPERFLVPSVVILLTNGAVILMGYLIVRDEKTQTALEVAHQKLQEYTTQAEELAMMGERNRLAREIHDTLGHYLTIVNTQIEAARTIMPNDPVRGDQLLQKAQTLTKEGLSEIRRSISALRAAPIELKPLPEAIQELVDEHGASGLTICYGVNGKVSHIGSMGEQVIFRAAQEGLTNIRKHARATHVYISLTYTLHSLILSIDDNGVGSAGNVTGFGLLGLQERVKLLNGSMRTGNSPHGGFQLTIEVPA